MTFEGIDELVDGVIVVYRDDFAVRGKARFRGVARENRQVERICFSECSEDFGAEKTSGLQYAMVSIARLLDREGCLVVRLTPTTTTFLIVVAIGSKIGMQYSVSVELSKIGQN